MSSIDLVILGIVLEKPQSAYDIQKDVEYHHFSRWTKISVPSIFGKVLQLSEKGNLKSDIVKGDKFADKAINKVITTEITSAMGWAYRIPFIPHTIGSSKMPGTKQTPCLHAPKKKPAAPLPKARNKEE